MAIRIITVLGIFGLLAAAPRANVLPSIQAPVSALQRYLARGQEPTVEYRALRHLEASNAHFGVRGWLDAWTEYTHGGGFRYEVVAEGGSHHVRNRVLLPALESERRMWEAREPQRASVTPENYVFRDGLRSSDGLAPLGITPRRKDVLLVEGSIFVEPDDGELRRIEGRLSKSPSIWTRRVDVVRQYDRIGGVRVPIAIRSTAHVLIAGESTFSMSYEYETVNGQRVGNPRPKASSGH